MPQFGKHFTIKEARACLPELRRQLTRINDLVAEIRKREEQESKVTTIVRQNGKGPVVSGAGPQREEAQRLLDEIRESGVLIKDLSIGLVDFPHFLNDDPENEVFLCWRFGEDTIEYWHEIEDGFAGRRKLE